MYLVKAFKTGQTFPSYNDNHKTLKAANNIANSYQKEGFHIIEIYKDEPKIKGYFGIERILVKTLSY